MFRTLGLSPTHPAARRAADAQARYRPAMIMLEMPEPAEQSEEQRLEIYNAHLEFIRVVDTLQYSEIHERIRTLETLHDPAPRFAHSDKKGLPVLDNGANLFAAIINHPGLAEDKAHGTSNRQKARLLTYLHDHCYPRYYAALVDPAIVSIMVMDNEFNRIMKRTYLHALRNHCVRLPQGLEAQVWRKLIHAAPGNALELFKTLLHVRASIEKRLQYAACWLGLLDNQPAILAAGEAIAKAITDTRYAKYKPEFEKIIKHNLLRLELGAADREGNPAVVDMLDRHRFFGIGKTTSKKIYIKIHDNDATAEASHIQEGKAFEAELNKKLMKQTGHEASFRLTL